MKRIFSNRCFLDNQLRPATISYQDGLITDINDAHLPDAHNYDNLIIMPGVIDAHVHVNEPGRTEWEGFESATMAAAAGGTTSLIDMPLNASPVTTTAFAFQKKLDASKDKLHINVGFYGGLIPGNQNELISLIEMGVLGIKCFLVHSGIDEFPNVGVAEIEKALPLLAANNMPLLVHAELADEQSENTNVHGSYQSYLASRPRSWENKAIELMAECCDKFNAPVHIVHVSSSDALPIIEAAKNNGLKLTAETCIQYIYFNAENIPDHNTLFKCAPPIREGNNNEKLRQALKKGILDFIATDHSPAPPSMKLFEEGNLMKAWGGIAGLQFLLPGAWSAMKMEMQIEEFIPLVTRKPAEFINMHHCKGSIQIGYDADFVIWNPEEQFIVAEKDILHRHKLCPFIGETLYGKTYATIVNGNVVFENNVIKQKNAGKWLLRK